jgi:predicted  nucleic acid-binding Zn-ribbon protein
MHPDTQLVIQIQGLDQRIAALEKEIAALPKHIATIEKALDSHLRKLEVDKAALAANQRDRKKMEGDIQMQEQKITKLRDQTLGAKTNEQYRAFQNEIEYAQKEIRKCEDRILELMSESETLDANVKKADAALKEEKSVVEGEKNRARDRTAADQKMLAEGRTLRDQALAKIAPATKATYERIRKKWNGSVIAEVVQQRCTSCQIVLRPQFVQDLRRGDQMMTCENCGRILYINPPVNFEDLSGPTSVPVQS